MLLRVILTKTWLLIEKKNSRHLRNYEIRDINKTHLPRYPRSSNPQVRIKLKTWVSSRINLRSTVSALEVTMRQRTSYGLWMTSLLSHLGTISDAVWGLKVVKSPFSITVVIFNTNYELPKSFTVWFNENKHFECFGWQASDLGPIRASVRIRGLGAPVRGLRGVIWGYSGKKTTMFLFGRGPSWIGCAISQLSYQIHFSKVGVVARQLSRDFLALGNFQWPICSFDPMTTPSGYSRSYEVKIVFCLYPSIE